MVPSKQPRPGSEPLVVVLLSCLSEAVNDQLRVGSDRSVLTTLVALEAVIPCSLYERVWQYKLVCIQPCNELRLLQ